MVSGSKAIVVPQNFITGGITGVSLLCYYATNILSPGIWYFIINTPLFLLGWKLVSRRFFLFSLYGIVFHSLGSLGGNDIIAIVLHQKFNIRMGTCLTLIRKNT